MTTKLSSGYPDLVRYLHILNLRVTDTLNPDGRIHFQKDTLSTAFLLPGYGYDKTIFF
jgi:hypothetical protein